MRLAQSATWSRTLGPCFCFGVCRLRSCCCLMNARGCGRMHCYFTGPFFLLLAVASLFYGLRLLPLGPHGWLYLGAFLLVGGGLLSFLPVWLWGRYRQAQSGAQNRRNPVL